MRKLLNNSNLKTNNMELVTVNQDIAVYFDKESRDILFIKQQYDLEALLSHHKDSTYLLKIFKTNELKCTHYLKLSFFCKQASDLHSNIEDFKSLKRSIIYESIDIILNHPYFNLSIDEAGKFNNVFDLIYATKKIEINRKNNKINEDIESFDVSILENHNNNILKFCYKYFYGSLFRTILTVEDYEFQSKIKNLFECVKIVTYKNLTSNQYIIEIFGVDYKLVINYDSNTNVISPIMSQDIFNNNKLTSLKIIDKYDFFNDNESIEMYEMLYSYISKNILYKKPNENTIEILKKNELYDEPTNLNPNYLDLIEMINY